tara:strand:- start:211 stop:588 length:378 start_codon:yes stop_codon:yes gene_type:complete
VKREIFDQWGGVVQEIIADDDGNVTFYDHQDAEPILEDNKARATSGNHNIISPGEKNPWARHVAHIPVLTQLSIIKKAGLTYREFYSRPAWWRRKLLAKYIYDAEYKHLLTSPHSTSKATGIITR